MVPLTPEMAEVLNSLRDKRARIIEAGGDVDHYRVRVDTGQGLSTRLSSVAADDERLEELIAQGIPAGALEVRIDALDATGRSVSGGDVARKWAAPPMAPASSKAETTLAERSIGAAFRLVGSYHQREEQMMTSLHDLHVEVGQLHAELGKARGELAALQASPERVGTTVERVLESLVDLASIWREAPLLARAAARGLVKDPQGVLREWMAVADDAVVKTLAKLELKQKQVLWYILGALIEAEMKGDTEQEAKEEAEGHVLNLE